MRIQFFMDLSLKALQEAVGIREQIDALEARLASLFSAPQDTGTSAGNKPKRTMSAAARRNIADAQRARWAKQRPASSSSSAKRPTRGGKRAPLSAEARARLAQSAKKRWAAAKRAGKSRL